MMRALLDKRVLIPASCLIGVSLIMLMSISYRQARAEVNVPPIALPPNPGGFGVRHVFQLHGGAGASDVLLVDLNGDGLNDIVTSNFNDASVSVLLNKTGQ